MTFFFKFEYNKFKRLQKIFEKKKPNKFTASFCLVIFYIEKYFYFIALKYE